MCAESAISDEQRRERIVKLLGRHCMCGRDFATTPEIEEHQKACLMWRKWTARKRRG